MMDEIWQAIYGDPLYYVGLFLVFWAAIGFLTFIRGFLSGVPHLFTYDGDDEYLPEHRMRAMWGPIILMSAWGVWELVRWLAAVFTGTSEALSFWLVLFLTIFIWLPALWAGVKKLGGDKKGGH